MGEEVKNIEVVAEEVAVQEVVAQEVATEEVVAEKAPADKKADKKAGKEVKVQFLLSPTGRFNLAYNIGEVAKINELQANELVEAGFAEIVK